MLKYLISVLFLVGCQTTQSEPQKLPSQELTHKGMSFGGEVGENADKKLVIRRTADADDELASLEVANSYLHTKTEQSLYNMNKCRNDLADDRLGGSGEWPEDGLNVDGIAPPKPQQQMGYDEAGNLVVIEEESFKDHYERQAKWQRQMKVILEASQKATKSCRRELAKARRAHGLQGKEYSAAGYYAEDGTFVPNSHGEVDLDDAQVMAARAGK